MSLHTPGPWVLHGPGSLRACDGRHDTEEGCHTIVEAEIIGVPRPEAEANAILIAAAPDLLAALKWALRTIRTWHGMGMGSREAQAWALYQASPEMQAILAAIAKAEAPS